MGAGNHTYGKELRGEGRGTFLTAAAALPLSVHPLFTGKSQPRQELTCKLVELEATPEKGKLTLAGRLEGGPRVDRRCRVQRSTEPQRRLRFVRLD